MNAATKRAKVKTKSAAKMAQSERAATKSPGSKTPTKSPEKADVAELTKVYAALCAILKPYQKKLKWKSYGKDFYYLETHNPVYKGKPMCYGGVRLGKNYVSYYLMSVYMAPELMRNMSPELKKRMQGKSCFNFTRVDPGLFAELKALTRVGSAKFDRMDWKALEAKTCKWTELRGKG
jgi:hypothetical protein